MQGSQFTRKSLRIVRHFTNARAHDIAASSTAYRRHFRANESYEQQHI
jgi:hypothetical protein